MSLVEELCHVVEHIALHPLVARKHDELALESLGLSSSTDRQLHHA